MLWDYIVWSEGRHYTNVNIADNPRRRGKGWSISQSLSLPSREWFEGETLCSRGDFQAISLAPKLICGRGGVAHKSRVLFVLGHFQPNWNIEGMLPHLVQGGWKILMEDHVGVRPLRWDNPWCPFNGNTADFRRYTEQQWANFVVAECPDATVLDIWDPTRQFVEVIIPGGGPPGRKLQLCTFATRAMHVARDES